MLRCTVQDGQVVECYDASEAGVGAMFVGYGLFAVTILHWISRLPV